MNAWVEKRRFLLRWRWVARTWTVERLLATTDLQLSEAERAELRYGIHSWRQLVPRYLERFDGVGEGNIYCFGVAHGSTVGTLVTGFRNRNLPVPKMHLFDSFSGLPPEQPGVAVPAVWTEGAFSAPRNKLEEKISSLNLPPDGYAIHDGWFKDTLKPELVQSGEFGPAIYVDIDADLYSSTTEVLDFLFAHKLIRAGTLIGYDDWGDTELWTAGESRAHEEMMQKHGARCAQLLSWGERPLIRKLFLVVSVDSR